MFWNPIAAAERACIVKDQAEGRVPQDNDSVTAIGGRICHDLIWSYGVDDQTAAYLSTVAVDVDAGLSAAEIAAAYGL